MTKSAKSVKKDEFSVALRDYQTRDAKIIEERWSSDNAILYQLPTGGGKSVVATKIIWDHRNEKTLILAHRKELLVQMRKHLQNQGLKVGLIIRDKHEDLDANIIIASIRTVSRDSRIDLITEQNFDNIIVDEAHRILTDSYDKVINTLKEHNSELKLLGLTATPTRRDKKSFADLFKTLLTSESTQSLIDKGYLANYRTFFTPVQDLDKEVQKYFNDYKLSDLSQYMRKPEMVQYAVDSYEKLGEGRQTITFCVDRLHARDIEIAYKDSGFDKVAYLDGSTPEKKREQILKDYENNKVSHIICIETLTEGVDLPETGCIQLLRPTLSLTLYLQMIGRGLRPKSDGSDLIILDNAGCSTQFGVASSPKKWSLNPDEDPNEGRKRNKVVGRRKDGSLTDDETEMEFLELVEMTPEEFAVQVSNGIEIAEEKNKELDTQAIDTLEKIANFFIEKLDDSEDWSFRRPSYIERGKVVIINKNFPIEGNNKQPQLKIFIKSDEDNPIFVENDCHYYSYAGYFPVISYVRQKIGELYKLLSQEKVMKKAQEMWKKVQEEVEDIRDKKVDIDELRRLVANAKADQFERQVAKHLETSNIFQLPNPHYKENYFKGHSNDKVVAIEIPKGKIVGHRNEIVIHTKYISHWGDNTEREIRKEKKDYIKGEKVYQIIKEGGWKLEVKQVETVNQ